MLRAQRLIVKKDLRTFSSQFFYSAYKMHDKQSIFTSNSFFLKCDLSTFRTKLFNWIGAPCYVIPFFLALATALHVIRVTRGEAWETLTNALLLSILYYFIHILIICQGVEGLNLPSIS